MKLNSPQSLKAAGQVFRAYKNSWTAAREAGHRNADGVLVIPRAPRAQANSAAIGETPPRTRRG